MSRLKKIFFIALLALVSVASVPIVNKALPIVRERECHRKFFPQQAFSERLKKPPAPWMLEQIKQDLSYFEKKKIQLEALDQTYEHLHQTAGYSLGNFRYRILGNQLYKFVPEGESFSDTDNLTEKALKTLLLYAKIPDCDFIICSMDGVPEPYLPSDYYRTPDPKNQAPIFAQAREESEKTQHIVLIPDQLTLSEHWFYPAQEILKANQEIQWEEKKAIAIWRGGLSDTGQPTDGRFVPTYDQTPRFAICQLSQDQPDSIDAGLTGLDSKEMEAVAKQLGLWKSPLSKLEHLKAKYLPVLDGHMCSYPGFQWRLLSNSACFKQDSKQIQWFYKALHPYVHYIPVKNDMSDLLDRIAWAKKHDDEVKKIVENAREFASQNLLPSDAYYYYHLVLSEYAKLQQIDFKALKKQTAEDPRWKCIQYRKRLALQKSFNKALKKLS